MNNKAYVKLLTNGMYDIQEVRKAVENRITMFSKSEDEETAEVANELQVIIAKKLRDTEDSMADQIAEHVKDIPITKWLNEVRGIGPRLSGSLIGIIGDLPDNISQLWSYCGMATIPVCESCAKLSDTKSKSSKTHKKTQKIAYQGEARIIFCRKQADRRWEQHSRQKEDSKIENEEEFKEKAYNDTEAKLCQCENPVIVNVATHPRLFKGLLLTYNPFLKMTCWKISGQFVKQGSYYRKVYEQAKARYQKNESLTKMHIENRARRYTVKLFLSHLHEMWSKSEGREVNEFYYKQYGDFSGHHYIPPPYNDIYDEVTIPMAAD